MAGAYGREVTLTIHGLPVDNGNVRADAFLSEFRALVQSLKLGDRQLNRRRSHAYLIIELNVGRSATATIRETVTTTKKRQLPAPSVPYVAAAVESMESNFSHAEIVFEENKIIRIDDYFAKQVERALQRLEGELQTEQAHFRGVSFDSFDGVLKEADARGVLLRGKLVLTGGNVEIDCVFNRDDIPTVRDSFDRRVRVSGIGHYDGKLPLPERLDVKQLVPIKSDADLVRWRGALVRHSADDEEDSF